MASQYGSFTADGYNELAYDGKLPNTLLNKVHVLVVYITDSSGPEVVYNRKLYCKYSMFNYSMVSRVVTSHHRIFITQLFD